MRMPSMAPGIWCLAADAVYKLPQFLTGLNIGLQMVAERGKI